MKKAIVFSSSCHWLINTIYFLCVAFLRCSTP